ncbi:MAG: YhjD/YihY/BrkB family envelope integrity protein, partial [Kiritimatiellae bacterium]|nr:YhjD/YihY/BrkB family envelope integrity protein [Kiritimatiellia bacterium]
MKSSGHWRRSGMGRLRRFFSDEIWDFELDQIKGVRRGLIGALRIVRMVWRGFRQDECQLHASALTYFSLMSLVPILALALALARVFGGENLARQKVTAEIAAWGQQLAAGTAAAGESVFVSDFTARMTRYADLIFDQIAAIGFGTLGGVGLIVLIWMAVGMLSQVERSFNRVWNAPPRPLWRKFSDYLSFVLIVPFLTLVASTIPVADFVARNFGGLVGGLLGANGLTVFTERVLVVALT